MRKLIKLLKNPAVRRVLIIVAPIVIKFVKQRLAKRSTKINHKIK